MSEIHKALELDALTGQVLERDLTEEELKFYKEIIGQSKATELAFEAKNLAKSSALAKLAALGLTEEEIAAL
jgi:hypothetical protein